MLSSLPQAVCKKKRLLKVARTGGRRQKAMPQTLNPELPPEGLP